MYQEVDRDRGLHPQSRKENYLVDQWRCVELLGVDTMTTGATEPKTE